MVLPFLAVWPIAGPATVGPADMQPIGYARKDWLPEADDKPVSPQSAYRYLNKGPDSMACRTCHVASTL
ncbi:MAG: hypothetical protein NXI04_26275 [Planctomycetaceae bacterium]|nr:hypothetical protein [Planctomycetaceae bacterium]